MPDALDLAVITLAAWRVATFLVREEGPWGIARRIRECVGIDHDDVGEPVGIPDGVLAQVLSCVWCCLLWTAAAMLAMWATGPLRIGVLVLGIAGAAVIVDVAVGRMQDHHGRS